jgi:5-methylcytosine-specific restriction endonuclease McrA
MGMNRELYPKNWKEISLRIRERDGQKCKFCGVGNKDYIHRTPDKPGDFVVVATQEEMDKTPFYAWEAIDGYAILDLKVIQVVLTVAHLDHDSTNNADSNLAALCQRCHLRLDTDQHKANSAKTRHLKKVAAGQIELFV